MKMRNKKTYTEVRLNHLVVRDRTNGNVLSTIPLTPAGKKALDVPKR